MDKKSENDEGTWKRMKKRKRRPKRRRKVGKKLLEGGDERAELEECIKGRLQNREKRIQLIKRDERSKRNEEGKEDNVRTTLSKARILALQAHTEKFSR